MNFATNVEIPSIMNILAYLLELLKPGDVVVFKKNPKMRNMMGKIICSISSLSFC